MAASQAAHVGSIPITRSNVMMRFISIVVFCLSLAGCAGVPRQAEGPAHGVPVLPPGRYHKVEKGQTLWRISRLYGVELQELVNANNINDSTKIVTGQLVRIPGDHALVAPPRPGVAAAPDDEDFIWPVRGKVLFAFGDSDATGANRGIAISPPADRDIVVASRSGKVVFCSDNFLDLGKIVIIEHAGGFRTVYGRNAEIFVKAGDVVFQGASIARTGRAGRDPARYLYFEIRKGHIPQNPNFYLPR
jgi:lipoprotein YgeR